MQSFFKKSFLYLVAILFIFSFLIGLIIGQKTVLANFEKKESVKCSSDSNSILGILGIKDSKKIKQMKKLILIYFGRFGIQ